MSQAPALLDTDILSELLKQHPQVTHRTRVYLAEHSRLDVLHHHPVRNPARPQG